MKSLLQYRPEDFPPDEVLTAEERRRVSLRFSSMQRDVSKFVLRWRDSSHPPPTAWLVDQDCMVGDLDEVMHVHEVEAWEAKHQLTLERARACDLLRFLGDGATAEILGSPTEELGHWSNLVPQERYLQVLRDHLQSFGGPKAVCERWHDEIKPLIRSVRERLPDYRPATLLQAMQAAKPYRPANTREFDDRLRPREYIAAQLDFHGADGRLRWITPFKGVLFEPPCPVFSKKVLREIIRDARLPTQPLALSGRAPVSITKKPSSGSEKVSSETEAAEHADLTRIPLSALRPVDDDELQHESVEAKSWRGRRGGPPVPHEDATAIFRVGPAWDNYKSNWKEREAERRDLERLEKLSGFRVTKSLLMRQESDLYCPGRGELLVEEGAQVRGVSALAASGILTQAEVAVLDALHDELFERRYVPQIMQTTYVRKSDPSRRLVEWLVHIRTFCAFPRVGTTGYRAKDRCGPPLIQVLDSILLSTNDLRRYHEIAKDYGVSETELDDAVAFGIRRWIAVSKGDHRKSLRSKSETKIKVRKS